MPELPEVETVKEVLKTKILGKKIKNVNIFYNKIIEYPLNDEFIISLTNQTINDIKRRGKWLLFELDNYYLLSHLRMEGKYNYKTINEPLNKHEHVQIVFTDDTDLRYQDTRKFGRMYLYPKSEAYNKPPLNELGLEPWDNNLTVSYLEEKYKTRKKEIKSVLLEQSIIVGIGNIYADEILFLSKINPYQKANELVLKDLQAIIDNTKIVLEKAIHEGGTTIKSYTSSEGVHGRFQQMLNVHQRKGEKCLSCHNEIIKVVIGGRGTYYCPICQKKDIL
ncbi:MAG: DNA-formamidopyrimidine glycosylase [Bacilli bacterium]|nr:DNA-formamidopyrimidine glycosylase [Bacilli bacterium]